jgi:hypothetical protein
MKLIYLNFKIKNPFVRDSFKNLFCRSGHIVGHKYWEFELWSVDELVDIELRLEWSGSDHAGPHIQICLFGIGIAAKIYDNRHWNYDTNAWEIYENET